MLKYEETMGFQEVVAYLLGIPKFTKKNQFEETCRFYAFLGKPGQSSKIVHVAGTNGKGSVCAYLQGMLQEAGHSCGLFTSPHLVSICERIQLENVEISKEAFTQMFFAVMERSRAYGAQYQIAYHPTFFEMLFFMAMLWFERTKPEYIILETGLGGRLDTTNVVENKALCILTKIALDHMEYLGEDLASIAAEKAGIIRPEVPVVYYAAEKEASAVFEKKIEECGCFGISFRKEEIKQVKSHEKFIDFLVDFKYYGDDKVALSTTAQYQTVNFGLALRAAEQLLGEALSPKIVCDAAQKVCWPCRMQTFELGEDPSQARQKRLVLDGAHNPDGMRAFIESARYYAGDRILLFSAVRDKNYQEMLREIAASGLFSHIYITTIGADRAGDEAVMKSELERGMKQYGTLCSITTIHNHEEAYQAALQCLKQGTEQATLFVAGSLYLAGAIRGLMSGM